jgi:hypothetical protein
MPLKRPVSVAQAKRSPKAAARRESFCARMGGMKKKLTGAKKKKDPGSRINKALANWDCDVPVLLKAKNVARGVRMNPVPPSSRAMQSRQVRNQIDQARDLYERFSGHDAVEIGSVQVQPMPKVGVAIGEVDGILYSTVRDGVLEKYIHKFRKKDRPLFVVSPDGTMLYLIGGNYDFTERGIVDHSDPSR